jgi:16S rRNA (guanine527-N7)-methyltransferase
MDKATKASSFNELQFIRELALRFKIELSARQTSLMGIYLNELWEWNHKFNLTGVSSRQQIIKELLIDSLIPCPYLPDKGRLLDIGSGAGLPAIPIKIIKPELTMHLMEPKSKRVNFLRQIIRLANLPKIQIIRGRIEMAEVTLPPDGYQIITARALAPLPKTLVWTSPWLAPGGRIVNFQGASFKTSLAESSDIIKKLGLYLEKIIPYKLPEKDNPRHILFFKRQDL